VRCVSNFFLCKKKPYLFAGSERDVHDRAAVENFLYNISNTLIPLYSAMQHQVEVSDFVSFLEVGRSTIFEPWSGADLKIERPGKHEKYLEFRWDIIEQALLKAWKLSAKDATENYKDSKKGFSKTEQLEVYTSCYQLCTHKDGLTHRILELFEKFLDKYIERRIFPDMKDYGRVMVSTKSKKAVSDMLASLSENVSNYRSVSTILRRFFCYLDRYYLRQQKTNLLRIANKKLDCVWDYLADIWRVYEQLIQSSKNETIFVITKRERGMGEDYAQLISSYIYYLKAKDPADLERFKVSFLSDSKMYYEELGLRWSSQLSANEYWYRVHQLANIEQRRNYFSAPMVTSLTSLCWRTFTLEWLTNQYFNQDIRRTIVKFLGGSDLFF